MAQAIQKNDHLVMIKNEQLLLKAEKLLPRIYEKIIYPQYIITPISDCNHIHGWSAKNVSDTQSYLHKSFQSGDSFILDFGTHCVGYLSFLCQSIGSPQDAPAHLKFTFGETLSEIAESFCDYQGWLSKSWLQQHDEYIDVLPSNISLSRRYCFRYLKIDVVSLSPKYQILFKDIYLKIVSSAPENCLPYHTIPKILC